MTQPDLWQLPTAAELEGRTCAIHSDYRDVLGVIAWLTGAEGGDLDAQTRWYVALRLFYPDFDALPRECWQAAAQFLSDFLAGGHAQPVRSKNAPRLLDWCQDAPLIVAGVNKVAGRDVRALPYLHWWSFLAFFDSIGEGTLSTVVGIRDKQRRGKKLEKWEQDFYRAHRAEVDLRPLAAPADTAERARLLALLS